MQALARSFTIHLLAPYLLHLTVGVIFFRCLPMAGTLIMWFVWVAYFSLLGSALIGIPFGVLHMLHMLQTVWFARDWPGSRKTFFLGLLNPSFAAITMLVLLNLAPLIVLPWKI